jgi:hypothetical protein
VSTDEYKSRIDEAHTVIGVTLQDVMEQRDSLLRQVEELRAEVSRLSQIAKY